MRSICRVGFVTGTLRGWSLADIFISYAREDRATIEKLAGALERAGWSVWWDARLESGSEFAMATEKALEEARAVVVCWSKASVVSAWVRDEAAFARERAKLVPLLLDASEPPLGFRQYQAGDFSTWSGSEDKTFTDLADILRRRIAGEVADTFVSPPASPPPAKPQKSYARAAVIAGLAVAIAATAFFFLRSGLSKEELLRTAAADAKFGHPTADQGPSVAVLPFDDVSPAADQGYFADGIAEELLNALSRIEGLRVSSRTSAFAFKGRNSSVAEIGGALRVGHVIEGSVRRVGDRVRIAVQLIDTGTDEHVWSETFERPFSAENIFAIQDEIAAAVAARLKNRLAPGRPTEKFAQTASTEAYEAYLRARQLAALRRKEPIEKAIEELNRVVALDPKFALGYAGLADAYVLAIDYAGADPKLALERASSFAQKALELAPESAEALTANASVAVMRNDYPTALDFAERAIASNANYLLAHHRRGMALNGMGRRNEGFKAFEAARALDPLNPSILTNLTHGLVDRGDIAGARTVAEENLRWNPDTASTHQSLGRILQLEGDHAGAHRSYKNAEALSAEHAGALDGLIGIYWAVGMLDEASRYADGWFEQAIMAIVAGDQDTALELAQKNAADPQAGIAFALAGGLDEAYRAFKTFFDQIGFGAATEIEGVQVFLINAFQPFERARDPDAAVMRQLLSAYYDGKKPGDFLNPDDLLVAAAWRAINDDAAGALAFFDEANARGRIFREATAMRAFDSLRKTPDYQKRLASMEAIAARHRAAIEAQLAAPEPGWVRR